ncbi:inorganic diphosphatase [Acinetobacter larvae]|uniref:Inorganic pyrophosphatase n=1 Tax=Acinetobacter larvae TaxID=1789224 RepID=A0A1B2M286_9GAMM|nr:inorganic diphosphatase [Acinetobacter larvae]AOA59316.1 inorganic pyrophosphatase [Acinetobacter larvae]
MSFNKISAGIHPPEDFYSIIEIPAYASPIKYEVNKAYDALLVDRFLSTAMSYPANYGYIPQSLSEDGDPLDVLVLAPHAVVAGSVIRSRPIGVMYMEDEHGLDAKIIAVPHPKLSAVYDRVNALTDLAKLELDRIQHFFEHYKDLETGKWMRFNGWGDRDAAQQEILKSVQAYATQHDHH